MDIRDMKWLTNVNQTTYTFQNNGYIGDEPTGYFDMNFADLEASDASGASYFVVGGRTYFES